MPHMSEAERAVIEAAKRERLIDQDLLASFSTHNEQAVESHRQAKRELRKAVDALNALDSEEG